MQFLTKQQIGACVTACLVGFAHCVPVEQVDGQILDTRQLSTLPLIRWWPEDNFQPEREWNSQSEPQSRQGAGDCQNMLFAGDVARSARAPVGWKCTFYDDKGCHGARTREFNADGIAVIEGPMFKRASAFRCCQIGQTNSWGHCDAKLNPGSWWCCRSCWRDGGCVDRKIWRLMKMNWIINIWVCVINAMDACDAGSMPHGLISVNAYKVSILQVLWGLLLSLIAFLSTSYRNVAMLTAQILILQFVSLVNSYQ